MSGEDTWPYQSDCVQTATCAVTTDSLTTTHTAEHEEASCIAKPVFIHNCNEKQKQMKTPRSHQPYI